MLHHLQPGITFLNGFRRLSVSMKSLTASQGSFICNGKLLFAKALIQRTSLVLVLTLFQLKRF